MNIQPITMLNCAKTNFTADNKRLKNVDRAVTVRDLYDMEDRINERLDKQDEAIAKGLWYIVDSVTFDYDKHTGKQALKRQKLEAEVCNTLVKLHNLEDLNHILFEQ